MVEMAGGGGGVSGRTDPFPGPAPVPRPRVKRFLRGAEEKAPRPVAPRLRWHLKNLENREKSAAEKAARWEPFLPEEPGFLEPEPGQDPARISQREIADAVDIASASKHFELRLEQFGPYRLNYTRTGRHLLLGGLRGHVAALDWGSRRLLCEFNVMEPLQDISWLHSEALLAVAQRRWLHVYDSQGLELHVLRALPAILRLEFLPYHFLLAAVSALGPLHFLDVAVGRAVAALRPRCGRASAMGQAPASGLVLLGHANGVVSLWSPSVGEPVGRLLAQRGSVRGLAADASGRFVATSGLDRKLRIFDLRNFGLLQEWGLPAGAAHLEFSQRGLLAAACGDQVQVYPAPLSAPAPRPLLRHRPPAPALALRFCPFEDVLGAGHAAGFSSILVPGAGEPNLDALENNPYRSRRQRQEWEVKALLEKIPAELLTPDPSLLSRLDAAGLEQKRLERLQRLGFDPDSKGKFRPRRRRKGREPERRRRQAAHEELRARIQQSLEQRERERKEKEEENQEEPPKKRRKKEGKTPQKSRKKRGGKALKNGEKNPKSGEKTGGKSKRNREKTGEKLPKNGGKTEEKAPKNQEKSQKIGEKIGESPPRNWGKPGGKAPKTQEKPPKLGQNPLKNGGKLPKIGKNPRETPKKKGKAKKGGPGPKLGGSGPKLGGSLPSKGALERFKK